MMESDQSRSTQHQSNYAPRILLAEADHGIRAFLAAELKSQKKYRVYEAPTLKALTQQLRSQPIDILVLGKLVEDSWKDELYTHLLHWLKQNLTKVKQSILLLPQTYFEQVQASDQIPFDLHTQDYFEALCKVYQMFQSDQISFPKFMSGEFETIDLINDMIQTRYRELSHNENLSEEYENPIRQSHENIHGLDIDESITSLTSGSDSKYTSHQDQDTVESQHLYIALRPQIATAIATITDVAQLIRPSKSKPKQLVSHQNVGTENTVLWIGPQAHRLTIEIQKACQTLNLKFKGVASAQKALRETRRQRFDIAFVYDQLDDMSGLSLVRGLRREIGESLPIAFVTSEHQVGNRLEGVHAGVSLFLNEESSVDLLTQSMRQLQTLGTHGSAKILMIDDDEAILIDHVNHELQQSAFQLSYLTSPFRVLELLSEVQTDLLIIHADMQDLGGIEVCRTLRATPEWQSLPIILMGERNDDEMHLAAYRSGADGYLPSYVEGSVLKACLESKLERSRMIKERADRDGLTGLLVRRAFNDALQARMATARRKGSSVAVCLIDLDHFKNINDTYGHIAGDKVLSTLGRLLSSSFRVEDLRGRWGGEEFVVAFSDEEEENAASILERARKEFIRFEFESDQGNMFKATFSAGVACFPEHGDHIEAVFKVADNRLYKAKEQGRNQIVAGVNQSNKDVRHPNEHTAVSEDLPAGHIQADLKHTRTSNPFSSNTSHQISKPLSDHPTPHSS